MHPQVDLGVECGFTEVVFGRDPESEALPRRGGPPRPSRILVWELWVFISTPLDTTSPVPGSHRRRRRRVVARAEKEHLMSNFQSKRSTDSNTWGSAVIGIVVAVNYELAAVWAVVASMALAGVYFAAT